MRVLWITNQPIGDACKRFGVHTSGTWMDPTLNDMKHHSDIQIGVAFVCSVDKPQYFEEDDIQYYALPRSRKKVYPYDSKHSREQWQRVIQNMNPDLIMIWGTEYAHGLSALLVASGIPAVIVIQGILESIARYYLGEMNISDIHRNYTLRNFLKHDSVLNAQRLYHKKSRYEAEMLRIAQNAILENRWSDAYFKAIAPNGHSFMYKTKIKDLFFDCDWKYEECRKHSIFCTSPVGYPLKGFHIMLRALALVKKQYPDVVLRVPGIESPLQCDMKSALKQSDYMRYVIRLIKEYDLQDSIEFLGAIPSAQIAQELKRASVFVLPSTIENQSMSLREAMAVGTPSVASAVGGVPEIMQDDVEGLLFRSGEFEYLSECIMQIFADSDKAKRYSRAARIRIREYYSQQADSATLLDIYRQILNRKVK